MAKKDDRRDPVTGRIVLDGASEQEMLALQVRRVDARGEGHPVEVAKDGSLVLDEAFAGQRQVLEVGAEGTDAPRRLRYDAVLERFRSGAEWTVPQGVWGGWFGRWRCVSGSVEVCRPLFLLDALQRHDAVLLEAAGLGVVPGLREVVARPESLETGFARWCRPVCNGRVRIFVRTCCCPWWDPWDVVRDICRIIRCWPAEIPFPHRGPGDPWPHEVPGDPRPPVGPLDGPGPLTHLSARAPAPGPDVAHVAALAQTLRQSLAGDPDLPGPDTVLELAGHAYRLSTLDPSGQREYLSVFPHLWDLLCHCSLVEVADVPLDEDGSFDACFRLPWVRPGCTQRVVHVVEQATPSGATVVYDGRVGPRTYGLDEQPVLRASWSARACDRDDQFGDVGVFLNRIGATSTVNLVESRLQDGERSVAGPLAAADGLVNGGANVWGGGLALRYSFHQDLRGIATYFRVTVQEVDADGDPVGPVIGAPRVGNPTGWQRIVGLTIVPDALDPGPSGPSGMWRIPYYADQFDLDANSYHAVVDTTALLSGHRYLFVLEVFDAAGKRVVPTNAGAPPAGEVAGAFSYLRQVRHVPGPTIDLVPVPQRTLAHLFHVDNVSAQAAFLGVLHNAKLLSGCLAIDAPSTDTVQVRYRAHHPNGWMASASLGVTRGIGPAIPVLSYAVPADTGPAPASADTLPPSSLASLLGGEHFCSFSANEQVTTRHTNGSGALTNLWAYAVGAFALTQHP